jgi:hypothetical protein
MMKLNATIVFITAIFGKYERSAKPHHHQQTVATDWVCFTNNVNLTSNGWQLDFIPYHLLYPSPLDDGLMINTLMNKSQPADPFLIAKYYKQVN